MTLFSHFIIRQLRREPARAVATVGSIALGIAVVVAIQLANAASVRGFSAALDAVSGRTTLEVLAPGGGVDETHVRDLDWLRDYGLVSAVIDADVRLRVPNGETSGRTSVRLLGVDILRDRPFRSYQLDRGDGAPSTIQQFLSILTDPEAIVLTRVLADRHGIGLDSRVELVVADRLVPLRVNGLLEAEGPATVSDGRFAIMDIAAAQLALGRLGRVDRIDVRLDEGRDVAEVERAIADRLPRGLLVQRPERRGQQVETMLAAFHFNLTALSYIALLVGLFLVYNTVSVSVITRRPEIGMLRTVGVSRRTILSLFLGEALALALAGSALGAPLGWVLARGAVRLTSSTVSTFWVATAATVPPFDGGFLLLAFAVGVPLSLAAAAFPAAEASRVMPIAAVRNEVDTETRARLPRFFLVVPLVLFVVGAGLALLGPVNGLPLFGLLSAVAVVFGAAFLTPALLYAVRGVAGGALGRWLGVEGELARANVGGSIRRLAISVAALSVSLAMTVAVAIMIGSFRETVIYWVGQTMQADLFVAGGRQSPLGERDGLSVELERQLAGHPRVEAIDGFFGVDVPFGDSLVTVGSGRFDVLLDHGGLLFKTPDDGRAALEQAIGDDAAAVSESFSIRYGVGPGDTITLPTPRGPARIRVAAVYYDYSNDRGLVVLDEAVFARHFGARRPGGLSLYLTPDADADVVREELLGTLAAERPVFITTNASLRRAVLRVFDSTFAITYVLEAIAIFVSMLGVAATLLTLALERRQDIAMLRLVGAERRHLRRMIMFEAGMLGLVSLVTGLAVGVALSLVLVYVINVQSFGWTIQFHLPLVFLAQMSVLTLVATAVSGLYPARLASRFTLEDLTVEG